MYNNEQLKDKPLLGEEEDIKRLLELMEYFHVQQRKEIGQFKRGQHTQGTGFVRAKFIVNNEIPKWAKVGIFQKSQEYDALIRFSNSSSNVNSDRQKTARGMAIKLLNVEGKKALSPKEMIDKKNEIQQDFLMTNHSSFAFPNVRVYKEFFELKKRFRFLPKSLDETLQKFFFFKVLHPELEKIASRPIQAAVANPLDLQYWSMSPYRLGANAIKFSAKPKTNNNDELTKSKQAPSFHGGVSSIAEGSHSQAREQVISSDLEKTQDSLYAALKEQLEKEKVCFDFMIQGRIESYAKEMPIEDASKEWPESLFAPEANEDKPGSSAFEPVAEIRIFKADENDIREDSDNEIFSPWHALEEHEPLGGINRLRRYVYHSSAYRRLNPIRS